MHVTNLQLRTLHLKTKSLKMAKYSRASSVLKPFFLLFFFTPWSTVERNKSLILHFYIHKQYCKIH